jgi:hypothetical protein
MIGQTVLTKPRRLIFSSSWLSFWLLAPSVSSPSLCPLDPPGYLGTVTQIKNQIS